MRQPDNNESSDGFERTREKETKKEVRKDRSAKEGSKRKRIDENRRGTEES